MLHFQLLLALLMLVHSTQCLQGDDIQWPNHPIPTTNRRKSSHPSRGLSLRRSPRIIGGSNVEDIKAYPFFAYWDVGCGATLLAPDLLLSAAHCYIPGVDETMGTMWLNTIEANNGSAYEVVQVWYHPQFDGDFYSAPKYDFLIARVNESIPANVATPVALNLNASVPSYTDEPLRVIGFGSLDEDADIYPDILQEVPIPYLETDPACQEAWDGQITEAELCTVNLEGGKDSCFGDSGGPVLTLDNVQVGIVSWGEGCGRPDAPAVASRISHVAESWIQPHVCLHSSAVPLPNYCQNRTVDLPLSLRLELISSESAPWQSQNISIGLFQVSPPEILYQVVNGVTIVNNMPLPPTTATSRKKEDKDKDREEDEEATTSLVFENLKAGQHSFTISQDVQDFRQVGTFQRVRLIQGEGINPTLEEEEDDRDNLEDIEPFFPPPVEHAWVDLAGSSFQGFYNQSMDLKESWALSDIQLPQTAPQEGPPIELSVNIFYDPKAPTETSWEVRDLWSNAILLEVPLGDDTVQPGLVSYSVQVPSNRNVVFRIWDAAGDGMAPGGWVEIWAGVGRKWWFGGSFKDEFSFELDP